MTHAPVFENQEQSWQVAEFQHAAGLRLEEYIAELEADRARLIDADAAIRDAWDDIPEPLVIYIEKYPEPKK